MNLGNILNFYYKTSLVTRIIAGIILGLICAILLPSWGWISILGNLFVGALKAIAPILVLVLVMSSLACGAKKLDGRIRTVVFFYIISTFCAAFTAVIASFLFPQSIVLSSQNISTEAAPAGIWDVIHRLLINIVVNPISSLTEGNYLGILFWAVVSGLALKTTASESTKNMLSDVSNSISIVVRWIIEFAPFGIMGLVYNSVSSNGIEIFSNYGMLILMLAGCMLFVYFVVNPLIVFCTLGKNPYPLILTCLKGSGITAFFTRSSAANIPINMELCEKLGLDKDLYSVSIPLGATINMNGGAVTISVMTLAVVSTLGISVSFPTAVVLSILATFAACGASGVAGGSLLLIPLACSLFGISNDIAMQAISVGFIIGVIQDSCETALDSSGDALFSAAAEYYQRAKRGKDMGYLGDFKK